MLYKASYRLDEQCKSYAGWQNALRQMLWPCLHQAYGSPTVEASIESRQRKRLRLVKTTSSALKIYCRPVWPEQVEPCYSVALVQQGRILHQTGGVEQILAEGDLLLTDNHQPYDLSFATDAGFLSMPIPKSRLPPALRVAKGLAGAVLRRDQPTAVVMGELMRTAFEHLNGLSDAESSILQDTLQQLTIGSLLKSPPPSTRQATRSHQYMLGEISQFLESQASNLEMTLEQVASHFDISLRQLYNVFMPTGMTPASYIWRCRLEMSRKLLADSAQLQLTMMDVAFRSGFNSASHFSKAFRAAFGCSPSEYRRHEINVQAGSSKLSS